MTQPDELARRRLVAERLNEQWAIRGWARENDLAGDSYCDECGRLVKGKHLPKPRRSNDSAKALRFLRREYPGEEWTGRDGEELVRLSREGDRSAEESRHSDPHTARLHSDLKEAQAWKAHVAGLRRLKTGVEALTPMAKPMVQRKTYKDLDAPGGRKPVTPTFESPGRGNVRVCMHGMALGSCIHGCR